MATSEVFEASAGALAFGVILVVLASALVILPFAAAEQGSSFAPYDFNTILLCCIAVAIFLGAFGLFYLRNYTNVRRESRGGKAS